MATKKVNIIQAGENAANFRANSARALYHERMSTFVGKPLADFVDSCAANPPSTPQKKGGKLYGKQEPVSGWVSYFTRNGYFSITQ